MAKAKKREVKSNKATGIKVQNAAAGAGDSGAAKLAEEEADKKLSPRKKVHKAQLGVLKKVDEILTANCDSAAKGNYNCAKFVLDWSGISDIRTPLAKPLKRRGELASMLQQLKRRVDMQAELEEQEAGAPEEEPSMAR